MRRSPWFFVLIGIYMLFVLSVALVRVEEYGAQEEGSRSGDLARAVIMLATTIGPAWVAELLMRRRAPAAELRKRIRLLRKQLWRRERQIRRAERELACLAQQQEKWDRRAARLRAVYDREHRRAEREAAGAGETGAT